MAGTAEGLDLVRAVVMEVALARGEETGGSMTRVEGVGARAELRERKRVRDERRRGGRTRPSSLGRRAGERAGDVILKRKDRSDNLWCWC